MTDKQTDELVKKKLVDYLNRMGHLPDKAGRYHCIATDHKDGNPSMTIHKSGAYATCWSHPSPKDSFTIFDAIGVFEGIQSPKSQKKRAYEIYQDEIDELAAELTAKADAKISDETKQSTHASKPKESSHAVPAAPKHEDKTAVKASEHKYSRPVKPDIFAPKPKEPPPPPEPIVLKTEEKVTVTTPEHKEPPPASAAPKAIEIETPPPASTAPKAEQKVAAKAPDHKEMPSPDSAASKVDTGGAAATLESKDEKTSAAKAPAPPVLPKTGSQRTMDNRPPSVDFQEWKKRVSQIYNLKLDSKPETPPRTPQIVKETDVKQTPPPAGPVKLPVEPEKTPIVPVPVVVPKQIKPPVEPVKTPIVSVPVVAPRQIKPAADESAKVPPVTVKKPEPIDAPAPVVAPNHIKPPVEPEKTPIESEKAPALPIQKPEPEPVTELKQSPPPIEPEKTPVEPEKAPALPIQKPEPEPQAEPVIAAKPVPAAEPVAEPEQSPPPIEPVKAPTESEKAPTEPEKAPAFPIQKPEPEPQAEPVTVTEPLAEPGPAAELIPEQVIDTYLIQNRMTSLLADLQSSDHAQNWSTTQSTGLAGLDELLGGGFRPGLYMICSKPGEGKTSFALQIADTIAAQGKDVLWLSLDMAREELLAKSLSRMTLLLDSAINKKNACTVQAVLEGLRDIPTKAVLQKVLQTYQQTMSSFYCQEALSEPSMNDIEHIISQHMTMTGSKPVVVIDCLQYIRFSDGLTETAGIDRAVRSLMQFSRACQIPVLALSANIRDSYNSDVIISLQMEPAAGTLSDPHVIELEILKNRYGSFNKKILFNFFAAFNCLEEK